ncbi:S-adenosyl-L-methionine-dependent methyltransferase [Durotheca rogersii]|uniref:S-adenosyl-L-methionine-dependent methyltransferase n=1 Tax=Durotheca rogersii TaxID=419775 RepID=UPI002220AA3F|nr:S-adenosyl-L-methionine-dependent methyltransferase [Durotheca rogersii]KAI5865030.1 S-adenosyl-L-methionine-dependent methyltransferase [Durotheca rogersii]
MPIRFDDTDYKLLQLGGLIQSSIAQYVAQRHAPGKPEGTLPSRPVFEAQRQLLSAAGSLVELVSDPSMRLVELSMQYFEARALHIVADKRVPDILDENGEKGLDIETLASRVGIESRKLSRVMRCLCSNHVFAAVGDDVYANNRVSASLVHNESLRAYIMLFALDIYSSSAYLPHYLSDPSKGASYAVEVTPWQDTLRTPKARWDWLEERVKLSDVQAGRHGSGGQLSAYPGVFGSEFEKLVKDAAANATVARPELAIFGLAMLGGGKVLGQAHLYDYPWASLGTATVVDVGGGVGGFSIQLSRIYPKLNFIVQDRAPVLKQAEAEVWPRENPAAIEAGRVKFVPHDFFQQNPVEKADIYWLRYVLHDWSDEYCVRILAAIKPAMGPRSRILVCDQVMNTTNGFPEVPSAPAPLPANFGYYTRWSHQRDLAMMSIINGIERKPSDFRDIIARAGLRMSRIIDCRSQVGLVEIVLPDSQL